MLNGDRSIVTYAIYRILPEMNDPFWQDAKKHNPKIEATTEQRFII